MNELVVDGRLPINSNNIIIIVNEPDVSSKVLINKYSADAGMTMIGFREETIKHEKEKVFEGYDELGTTMFVHSHDQKTIK